MSLSSTDVLSSQYKDVARLEAGRHPTVRQGVAARLLSTTKPPPRLQYHCLVVTRRPLIGLHRDGLHMRAGDGARTRDSLLGRQAVAISPLVWYETAREAKRTTTSEFRTALRKGVARPRHMRSTGNFGRMLHPQVALEQLYQNFCVHASETSCLILRVDPCSICLCPLNKHCLLPLLQAEKMEART